MSPAVYHHYFAGIRTTYFGIEARELDCVSLQGLLILAISACPVLNNVTLMKDQPMHILKPSLHIHQIWSK